MKIDTHRSPEAVINVSSSVLDNVGAIRVPIWPGGWRLPNSPDLQEQAWMALTVRLLVWEPAHHQHPQARG
jgi:hypothetical protein